MTGLPPLDLGTLRSPSRTQRAGELPFLSDTAARRKERLPRIELRCA